MAERDWFCPSETSLEENVFKVGAYERVFDRVAVVVESLHHILSPTFAEPKCPTKENLVKLNEALEDARVKSLELKSHFWLRPGKISVANPRKEHIRFTQSCVHLKVIHLLVDVILVLLSVHSLVAGHASCLKAFRLKQLSLSNVVPLCAIGIDSEAVVTRI